MTDNESASEHLDPDDSGEGEPNPPTPEGPFDLPESATGAAAQHSSVQAGPPAVQIEPPADKGKGTGIRSGKLAGRSLGAAILIIALPVGLQQFAQATVGLVDQVLAGHLPGELSVYALDAVGVGSYIGWFINIAMSAMGIGGAALIARGMGAGNYEQSHQALAQAIGVALIWSVVVGALLWFVAPWLAHNMMQLQQDSADYFIAYVRILALGLPFSGVLMTVSTCLHGAGETTWPLIIMLIMNVVNVVASWILCGATVTIGDVALVPPLGFEMGVAGIAWGTVVGWVVGGILIMGLVLRGVKDLRLELGRTKPDGSMIRRIIRVGLPGFADGMGMWVGNLFVLGVIGIIAAQQGIAGIQGAHAIAIRWESFSFLPGFAIGTAAGTIAGQMLGAGNVEGAKRAMAACALLGCSVMGAFGALFILEGEFLTRIISDDPIHLKYTPIFLVLGGATMVFFSLAMVLRQGMRGAGDTRTSMFITYGSTYLIRLPAAYLLGVTLGLGMVGVWWALCGELVIRGILYLAAFYHGRWSRITV